MAYCDNKKTKYKLFIIPFIGLSIIISSLLLNKIGKEQITINVEKKLVLKPNSTSFNYWTNPPAKVLRKFYFFNITNPKQFENGAKPILEEKGPYSFIDVMGKKNIMFLNENLINYSPTSTIYFSPEDSIGNDNDEIIFLNIPALGFIQSAKNLGKINLGFLMNMVLKLSDSNLLVKKTVRELVSGYEDPIMKMANKFLPETVKESKFSLINGKNGTIWQNITMDTGVKNIKNIGLIHSWNNVKSVTYWDNEYANRINGSDGSMFPPYLTKDNVLYSFSADMCRSYHLVFSKEDIYKNIRVYDFHLPENIFFNSTLNPDNEGFCKNGKCLGNGVLDIGPCSEGAPAYISQPHFLNADQKFIDAVVGLKPDKNKHDFVIKFEPTTGVGINGNIRLQINFLLTRSSDVNLFSKIKPVLLPVVWFESTIELFDGTLKEIAKIEFYSKLMNYIAISFLIFGFVIFGFSIPLIIYQFCFKEKNKRNTNKNINQSIRLLNEVQKH